jgi:GT2 family glycosyltransferase
MRRVRAQAHKRSTAVSERKIHAVVVAYDAAEQLDACLAALEQAVEVTVVDNSSSPLVAAVVAARRARYVDAKENLGFARGVNVAVRELLAGTPQDILLLNPDAALRPRQLDLLAAELHRPGNERVAAVAPRLIGAGGNDQRVNWPFPSPARAWFQAFGLGMLPARSTFAIGAVLLLRWEAIREVGLFDQRFFLYAEEADWQRRASRRGWSSSVCENAVARHAGAGTSTDPQRRETLFHAAQETFIRKWYGPAGWLSYRTGMCVGAAIRAIVLRGPRRAEALRRGLIYLRGPRSLAFKVHG